jgi:t-SNARE complex subunit (syntaxin)
MTGNKAIETIIGRDQFLMSLFIIIFPDATADEIALSIYNNGGQIYERSKISNLFRITW